MPQKWQLFILIFLAAIISIALSYVKRQPPEFSILRNITTIVAILGVAILIYDRWLWRFPGLYPTFVYTPPIRGTYDATAAIDYFDPTRKGAFPCYIVIKQTSSHILLKILWDDKTVSRMAKSSPMSSTREGNCAFAGTYRLSPQNQSKDFGIFFYYDKAVTNGFTLYFNTNDNDGQKGSIVLTRRLDKLCSSHTDAKKTFAKTTPPSRLEKLLFTLRPG
jgi:SMODS-associating 2TM, beta-strand rich effector domain